MWESLLGLFARPYLLQSYIVKAFECRDAIFYSAMKIISYFAPFNETNFEILLYFATNLIKIGKKGVKQIF